MSEAHDEPMTLGEKRAVLTDASFSFNNYLQRLYAGDTKLEAAMIPDAIEKTERKIAVIEQVIKDLYRLDKIENALSVLFTASKQEGEG